ncbi:MAG: exopolysaccharide biosynthesis protein [Paracoccaceae bacterium]
MPNGKAPETLTDILDAFSAAGENGQVTVRAVVDEIGDLSFAPALLVPALILISPLSGLPGLPTMGAIIEVAVKI